MYRSSHPAYGKFFRDPSADAAPPARRAPAGPYTIGHRGRLIRFGPIAFWSIVGGVVIMVAWSLASATYFAFREDVLARLIARQAHMQYAYEDRIADLRTQIDRLASRQLLDQGQFEHRLEGLVRRQSVLESRAATLSTLPDSAPTGSTKPQHSGIFERSSALLRRALAIGDTDSVLGAAAGSQVKPAGIESVLARLELSLDRVETRQNATLHALEDSYDAKAQRMRGVLTELRIEAGSAPKPSAVGGPFVPAKLAEASPFERQLYRVQLARSQVDALSRTLVAVPVRKPIPGEVDMTSGFGVRVDPFLHGAAMHTGIDLRGEEGEPVRATAAGTVTHAGRSGGYGKMVEIDHRNGLATRYAHLSAIDVNVGDKVQIGQTIGKLGSTGRSTGPHLHYETRVEGEAVDPQKFLRAGLRLGSAP
jgi:murein DD-endopeptidase MepM/ murein hydrolase activator NlpD